MPGIAPVTGVIIEILPEDDLSIPEGWQLLEDESVEEPDGQVTLEDFLILESDENFVSREEILRREMEAGKQTGLRTAKALLRQQHLIPSERQGYGHINFAGTVTLDTGGNRRFACLAWGLSKWFLRWGYLGQRFGSHSDRVVRVS